MVGVPPFQCFQIRGAFDRCNGYVFKFIQIVDKGRALIGNQNQWVLSEIGDDTVGIGYCVCFRVDQKNLRRRWLTVVVEADVQSIAHVTNDIPGNALNRVFLNMSQWQPVDL